MKLKIIAATVAVAVLITAFILGASGIVDLSEKKTQTGNDRLIGILVTKKSLFDYYPGEFEDDSGINSDEPKFYFDFIDKTETHSATGEVNTYKEISFGEVDGYWFTATVTRVDEDQPSYCYNSNVVSDIHSAYNLTDTGSEEAYEGKLYLIDDGGDNTIWISWLYQKSADEVYAVPYKGLNINANSQRVTIDDTFTTEVKNGDISEVQTVCLKFSLEVKFVSAPVKTVISQFDGFGNIISRDEFFPKSIPETFTANEKTEYIVIESFNSSEAPTLNVKREIIGKDSDCFDVYVPRDDNVCEIRTTPITWQ